jgi:hypothetical protein
MVAMSTQDAITIAAQAPRTFASRWRRTARAIGIARIAGVGCRKCCGISCVPQIGAMPELWQCGETILTALEAGTVVDPLPPAIQAIPALASLYRSSVQP